MNTNKRKLLVNSAALILMAGLHLLLIFLPSVLIEPYFFVLRPIAYAMLFIVFYSLIGKNEKN